MDCFLLYTIRLTLTWRFRLLFTLYVMLMGGDYFEVFMLIVRLFFLFVFIFMLGEEFIMDRI